MLVYYPSGDQAGGGVLLFGQGDGSALWSGSGSQCTISQGFLTDFNGDNPLQVANAYADLYSTGLPDLLAISGDPANGYHLDCYSSGVPCLLSPAFAINTMTPDGTADWNEWTLATLSDGSGTGMFLWNKSGSGSLVAVATRQACCLAGLNGLIVSAAGWYRMLVCGAATACVAVIIDSLRLVRA